MYIIHLSNKGFNNTVVLELVCFAMKKNVEKKISFQIDTDLSVFCLNQTRINMQSKPYSTYAAYIL